MATRTSTRQKPAATKQTVSTTAINALIAARSKRSYTDARSERLFWKNALKSLTQN